MLKIDILAVGKLKERFWKDACAEYLKRLQAYAKVRVQEIPDSNPEREGTLLENALDGIGDARILLLDIEGREYSSPELARKIERFALEGVSRMVFVIGGSEGVSAAVKAKAHDRLSFGRITLPHNLARVVLLEQLYRAFKISRGEPYHK